MHQSKHWQGFSDLKVGIRELSFPLMQEPTEKQPLQSLFQFSCTHLRVCCCLNIALNILLVEQLIFNLLQ